MLADVSRYAAQHGLGGMEFAIGIPGSIGGAVFMNAGAYSGEMCQVVTGVLGVLEDGSIQRFKEADIAFGYRHSAFQGNGCIICEVELNLQLQEKPTIEDKMNEYTMKRETKQPLEMPSAGSTFKRPPGNFAGTLIEQAGLKGFTVGGAQVSTKHAGFVVNAGGATAQDVLQLIKEVQSHVYEHSGVMLEPEVRIVGEE
jgi:UDP-N-acetylmuramate dehydrogenase